MSAVSSSDWGIPPFSLVAMSLARCRWQQQTRSLAWSFCSSTFGDTQCYGGSAELVSPLVFCESAEAYAKHAWGTIGVTIGEASCVTKWTPRNSTVRNSDGLMIMCCAREWRRRWQGGCSLCKWDSVEGLADDHVLVPAEVDDLVVHCYGQCVSLFEISATPLRCSIDLDKL